MPSSLLLCSALLSGPAAPLQEAAPRPVAEGLPAATLLHFEMPDLPGSWASLAQTDLGALLQDPEVTAFFAPILAGLRADLDFLLREEQGLAELLWAAPPRSLSASLVELEIDASGEPKPFFLILSAEFPKRAAALFELLAGGMERENPGETARETVAGRPAVRFEDQDLPSGLVQDGERLIAWFGTGSIQEFFERSSGGLAASDGYQAVRRGLGISGEALFLYCDLPALLQLLGEVVATGLELDAADRPAAAELLFSSPAARTMRGAGYALAVEGAEIRDRLFIYDPSDHASWGARGPLGDAARRHAALLDAGVDALFTSHLDAADYLRRAREEEQRQRRILERLELDEETAAELGSFELSELLEKIREKTGIDLEQELPAVLGDAASLFVSLPRGSFTAIPELGVIADLKDPAAADALFDRLLAADEAIAEVSMTTREVGGQRLISVTLLNAGLPVVPTLCRADRYLLAGVNPLTVENLLKNAGQAPRLSDAPDFAARLDAAHPDRSAALWMDVGGSFEYLYGLLGFVLSAVQASGAELSSRWDPALLPPGELLSTYLGSGSFSAWEEPEGLVVEGRSTLANPLIGIAGATLSGVAFTAAALGLEEEARDQRTELSRENMEALGQALAAYQGSVGAGSYPDDLIKLLDRGILSDAAKLVDPNDPAPRRVRSGSGERVAVSYALILPAALPAAAAVDLPEGTEIVLYTRGAWHGHWDGKARLLLPVGPGVEPHVRYLAEEDWGE